MEIEVRKAEPWELGDEPDWAGKVLVFGKSDYSPEMVLTLAQLIDLRCEIDRFLFTRLTAAREIADES